MAGILLKQLAFALAAKLGTEMAKLVGRELSKKIKTWAL